MSETDDGDFVPEGKEEKDETHEETEKQKNPFHLTDLQMRRCDVLVRAMLFKVDEYSMRKDQANLELGKLTESEVSQISLSSNMTVSYCKTWSDGLFRKIYEIDPGNVHSAKDERSHAQEALLTQLMSCLAVSEIMGLFENIPSAQLDPYRDVANQASLNQIFTSKTISVSALRRMYLYTLYQFSLTTPVNLAPKPKIQVSPLVAKKQAELEKKNAESPRGP